VATKPNSAVRSTEVCNAGLNLWAEMAHEALDGPCRCIAQSTDCAAFNLFSVGEKIGGLINIFLRQGN
jgi:hypothetical protein